MSGPSFSEVSDSSTRRSIWAAFPFIMAYWMGSLGVIFMNASILHKVPCPAALTAWHMLVSSILVRILRLVAPGFMGSGQPAMKAGTILKRVLPVSFLFALTLGVGNRAYVYLSVAFVQMVKASHPVLTYIISCLIREEEFRRPKLEATVVVTIGVMLSVQGELHFHFIGFLFQIFGSVTECGRVVLIGQLLNKQGLKMDPLTALSYYAPLAFLFLVPLALCTEVPSDPAGWIATLQREIGFGWLMANGLTAFTLNLAVVALIGRTDPVVYVVVGVLKDILTVTASAAVLKTPVTAQQIFGYVLALVGVQIFNLVQKRPEAFEKGLALGLQSLWQPKEATKAE